MALIVGTMPVLKVCQSAPQDATQMLENAEKTALYFFLPQLKAAEAANNSRFVCVMIDLSM